VHFDRAAGDADRVDCTPRLHTADSWRRGSTRAAVRFLVARYAMLSSPELLSGALGQTVTPPDQTRTVTDNAADGQQKLSPVGGQVAETERAAAVSANAVEVAAGLGCETACAASRLPQRDAGGCRGRQVGRPAVSSRRAVISRTLARALRTPRASSGVLAATRAPAWLWHSRRRAPRSSSPRRPPRRIDDRRTAVRASASWRRASAPATAATQRPGRGHRPQRYRFRACRARSPPTSPRPRPRCG